MNKRVLIKKIMVLILLILTQNILAKNFILEEQQSRKHIVQQGDTIYNIANEKGFKAEELIIYNKLDVKKNLKVGQIIYFPANPKSDILRPVNEKKPLDASQFYDTIADTKKPTTNKIANNNNTTEKQIQSNSKINNISNNEHIKATYEAAAITEENILLPEPLKKQVVTNTTAKLLSQDKQDKQENKQQATTKVNSTNQAYIPPKIKHIVGQKYAINGNDELLKNVLKDFATNYNIPIVIEIPALNKVNGKISSNNPEGFLDYLSSVFNFLWYFDGHSLYIYDNNAITKQLITLNYISPKKLKQTLQQMEIWDDKFYWKDEESEKLVMISGPVRYVETILETAKVLDAKEGETQKSKLEVRSFPLKYAWATDKNFNFRGQKLTVPGVASILQNIIEGGGIAKATETTIKNKSVEPAMPYRQTSKASATEKSKELNAGTEAESVYISADPRLNAVIVHDLGSKMPMYTEIIKSLDKPTKQIEIGISIIDINTEYLTSLGIEWSNAGLPNQIEFNKGSQPLASAYTVISSTIGEFTNRIKMLSSQGKVKVIAKPSIITLDNLESIIDNSSTYYVSVAGERDSELFPITSGTVVRVTPHIIADSNNRNKIHLSVNIQDGNGDDGTPKNGSSVKLPSTTNSSISTQAVVCEQESLLIGGFYKETEDRVTSKVPLLGDFPILGYLFQAKKKHKIKNVRLFLITPLIISS